MLVKKEITSEQAAHAISTGEFANEVISSAKNVILVMTQDWCPQWTNMKSWLYNLETPEDVIIFELVYNKVQYFYDFLNFKEKIWNNYEVPYLRYYKDGVLIKQSNYVGERRLKEIAEL